MDIKMDKKELNSLLLAGLLAFILVFMVGCQKPEEQINAEQKARQWVHSQASLVHTQFFNNFTLNVPELFYVLSSLPYQSGFCVEIASTERIPPKYKSSLSSFTTLPVFVSGEGKVVEGDIHCFAEAYQDKRGDIIKLMNSKLHREQEAYSVLRFFLVREVGNALSKTRLKEMGYKPSYKENPAAEYFTDALLLKTIPDEQFNTTMRIYVKAVLEINGEEMIDEYVKSLK